MKPDHCLTTTAPDLLAPQRGNKPAFVALLLIGVALSTAASFSAFADAPQGDSLADLSLEELTNIKISSVTRKTQRATDAAAAVYVITQDDIRRSGATSIPQALRLVPGLQVAQIDGNKWAITARGLNSRFANRLLVLMDGRTLYTLTFGGVFWDAQDTMIEDIERIEVIRGPGGAIWGSNAFNGVINIITKNASQTDGALVVAETGTQRPINVSARIGDTENKKYKWRVFAKGMDQNANANWLDQHGNDDWRTVRLGGRADVDLDGQTALQVSAEAYQGRAGMDLWDYKQFPNAATLKSEDKYDGAFIATEWSHQRDGMGRIAIHAVADHSNRDSLVFNERRQTYDLELQHNLVPLGHHDLMWGLGWRYTKDDTQKTVIDVVPNEDTLTIYSGFVQDELAVFDDALHVTVGAKLEHSDYIGTQLMPNLRIRHSINDNTTIWSAASRGVRSGSRLERDVRVTDAIPTLPSFTPDNPTPVPLGVEIWGDKNFAPEKLTAYELGLRHRINEFVSIDLAAYYNDYSNMRGVRLLPAVCVPSMIPAAQDPTCVFTATKIAIPMQYTNLLKGNIRGAELTVALNPLRYWRLLATYSYLDENFQNNAVDFGGFQIDFAQFGTGLDARSQWTLRSSLSLGATWDWDISLRHVAELPTVEVEAYSELDTRLAWRPRPDLELALIGQNLLHNRHREYVSDFIDIPPAAIKRSLQLQARWSF